MPRTVAELRAFLANLPDNTPVFASCTDEDGDGAGLDFELSGFDAYENGDVCLEFTVR